MFIQNHVLLLEHLLYTDYVLYAVYWWYNKIKALLNVEPESRKLAALLGVLSVCATPAARALPVLQTLFVFCSRTSRIYYFVRVPPDVEETDLRAPIE